MQWKCRPGQSWSLEQMAPFKCSVHFVCILSRACLARCADDVGWSERCGEEGAVRAGEEAGEVVKDELAVDEMLTLETDAETAMARDTASVPAAAPANIAEEAAQNVVAAAAMVAAASLTAAEAAAAEACQAAAAAVEADMIVAAGLVALRAAEAEAKAAAEAFEAEMAADVGESAAHVSAEVVALAGLTRLSSEILLSAQESPRSEPGSMPATVDGVCGGEVDLFDGMDIDWLGEADNAKSWPGESAAEAPACEPRVGDKRTAAAAFVGEGMHWLRSKLSRNKTGRCFKESS